VESECERWIRETMPAELYEQYKAERSWAAEWRDKKIMTLTNSVEALEQDLGIEYDKVKAELEKLREGAGQMVDNLSGMSAARDIECQAWRDQAPHGTRCASRHCGDCGGKALMCCPPCDCYRAALLKEHGHG